MHRRLSGPATVVAALALAGSGASALASGTHAHGHDSMKQGGMPAHGAVVDHASAQEHPFGRASDPAAAVHTVRVEMSDKLRFDPVLVEVERDATVRFVVRNNGKLVHEMVLGTSGSLHEHEALMKKFPGMEHEEPHMAHVPPGETREIGWQFTQPGEFMYGCLVPGHFDAGMTGRIIVR